MINVVVFHTKNKIKILDSVLQNTPEVCSNIIFNFYVFTFISWLLISINIKMP